MEFIPGLLAGIDRAKQSAISSLGLLFDDPAEFVRRPNEDARVFNESLRLASQKRRNELAGKPVTQQQQAADDYVNSVMMSTVAPDAIRSVGGLPLWNLGQRAVSENVRNLALSPQEFADFTFLMSPRQQEMLIKRQAARKGELPDRFGVLVSPRNKADHPLESRPAADNMTTNQVADLFESVYDGRNQIGIDQESVRNFFLVNTKNDFGKFRKGVGLFEIRDGQINPLTAYPASKEKVEGILAAPKKGK